MEAGECVVGAVCFCQELKILGVLGTAQFSWAANVERRWGKGGANDWWQGRSLTLEPRCALQYVST